MFHSDFLGSTAVFKCAVEGEPKPTIQWSKGKWQKFKPTDKIKIYEDDKTGQQVFEISDIKTNNAGTYLVSATNEHGTAEAPATLIVTDNPEEAEDWLKQLKHRLAIFRTGVSYI